eukprot:729229-Rhodomonas_salina.2
MLRRAFLWNALINLRSLSPQQAQHLTQSTQCLAQHSQQPRPRYQSQLRVRPFRATPVSGEYNYGMVTGVITRLRVSATVTRSGA